jgi:hypothetical protein
MTDEELADIQPSELIQRLNLWLSDVIALEISAAIASPRFQQLKIAIIEDLEYIINMFVLIQTEIEMFKDDELAENRRLIYAAVDNIDEINGTVDASIMMVDLLAAILEQVPGINQPRLVPRIAVNQRPW